MAILEKQQIGIACEYYVAGELSRLGYNVSLTFSSTKSIDLLVEKDDSTGGDYWVRIISALNSTFRNNDNHFISDKISNILADYRPAMDIGTRVKYDRNIQILHNYEDFDCRSITPSENIEIKNKIGKRGVIELHKLNIKVEMHNIYTFEDNEMPYMGSVFFAAKIKGYKIAELGMFAEVIYN